MPNTPPTLRGSLSQLQRAVAKYYSLLQQHFEGNYLISGMWAAMGHDLQMQAESLKKLPPSFWQSLANQERELVHAAEILPPPNADKHAGSLRLCLARTIEIEEPIILKIYAPLTRRLRLAWTELALDFYVMVKAHISRVAQSVQLFSGDPDLGQRCALLLQSFEREVQEQPEIAKAPSGRRPKKVVPVKGSAKKPGSRQVRAEVKKEPVPARVKIAKRTKHLVQKIKLAPRRARR